MVVGINLPSTIQMSVNFRALWNYIIALLKHFTFKFGNFTNIEVLLPLVSMDFPELVHVKIWKNCEKV